MFPLRKSLISFLLPLLTNTPTPAPLSWHSPKLTHRVFTGPRASAPIDARQCHALLHTQLEPWVFPFVLFGWQFSPWKIGGGDLEACCCFSSYEVANPFSSFSPFLKSSVVVSMLSTMVGCEHLPLYLSGSNRASQVTAISGSCQQTILGLPQ